MQDSVERSHGEIKIIMGALMLALFLSALDQTIVSTALPRIAVDLHGLDKLSWVATAVGAVDWGDVGAGTVTGLVYSTLFYLVARRQKRKGVLGTASK